MRRETLTARGTLTGGGLPGGAFGGGVNSRRVTTYS